MPSEMIPWVMILSIPLGALLVDAFKHILIAMERNHGRKLLRELTSEKLEVIKSAINMGYDADQIAKLDERLKSLVGEDHFKDLTGKSPHIPVAAEVPSLDLEDSAPPPDKPSREGQAQ